MRAKQDSTPAAKEETPPKPPETGKDVAQQIGSVINTIAFLVVACYLFSAKHDQAAYFALGVAAFIAAPGYIGKSTQAMMNRAMDEAARALGKKLADRVGDERALPPGEDHDKH